MSVVTYLFPSVRQRIDNLLQWRHDLEDAGPVVERIDARIRDLVHTEREVGEDFATQYPALERWRVEVLGNRTDRTPLEVAAAFELSALVCESIGERQGADLARRRARMQLVRDAG